MSILRQSRLAGLAVVGIPLMALVVAVVLLVWSSHGAGNRVAATDVLVPAPGLDFSIAIDVNGDTTDDCDSTAGPTGCQLPNVGDPFTLKFYLNSLPDKVAEGYQGYESFMTYTGLTCLPAPEECDLPDTSYWPDRGFDVGGHDPEADPPEVYPAAAFAPGAPPSTYTGLMATYELVCTASGTITLYHGQTAEYGGTTVLAEDLTTVHAEGDGATETLNVTCGTAPQPTDTPTNTPPPPATETPCPDGICPTGTPTTTAPPATATNTPRPPTDTPTPPECDLGDADGDGDIDSVDALWVLWEVADLYEVPFPECADVDEDGDIDALDALFILQYVAELIDSLPPS